MIAFLSLKESEKKFDGKATRNSTHTVGSVADRWKTKVGYAVPAAAEKTSIIAAAALLGETNYLATKPKSKSKNSKLYNNRNANQSNINNNSNNNGQSKNIHNSNSGGGSSSSSNGGNNNSSNGSSSSSSRNSSGSNLAPSFFLSCK